MMPAPKHAMEIFKLLDKSNCGQCGQKTCLAFAGAVYRGQSALRDCPKLERQVLKRYAEDAADHRSVEQNREAYLNQLKAEVAKIDLPAAARRVGGSYANRKLTLKVLGKNFSVDETGNLSADIHINPWVAVPFLNHILHGTGQVPTGNWVSFRELKGGKARYPLFQKRCETPMKQVADTYTELFDDMVHIFNGEQVAQQFESDISVVLHPLPRVPIMVCYWRPDDGLASSLNLYFDQTANANLDIGAIFSLGAGLAQMFAKLSLRHGFPEMRTE